MPVTTRLAPPPALAGLHPTVAEWLGRARTVKPGQRVMEAEGTEGRVLFVHSGWLARCRFLADGRRQIITLLLAGDHVQPVGPRARAGDLVLGLAPSQVASIPVREVAEARAAVPALSAWLILAERRWGAMLEERVVALGQRNALERMAHLFCELLVRTGGGEPATDCALPLTQTDLADILGLSVVHTNRTLQGLRRSGLAEVGRGRLRVADFHALAEAAAFDPAYLS